MSKGSKQRPTDMAAYRANAYWGTAEYRHSVDRWVVNSKAIIDKGGQDELIPAPPEPHTGAQYDYLYDATSIISAHRKSK